MHPDHGAGKGRTDHGVHDRLDAGPRPVARVDGVAHGGQSADGQLVEHRPVERVVGRPDAGGSRSRDRGDEVLGLVDLVRVVRDRDRGQVRVAPGVVLDRLAGRGQQLREVGVGGDLFADLEERARHVVLLQHRQHGRRVDAGAVVEGERDHPLTRRGLAVRGLPRVEGGRPERHRSGRTLGRAHRAAGDQEDPERHPPPPPGPTVPMFPHGPALPPHGTTAAGRVDAGGPWVGHPRTTPQVRCRGADPPGNEMCRRSRS